MTSVDPSDLSTASAAAGQRRHGRIAALSLAAALCLAIAAGAATVAHADLVRKPTAAQRAAAAAMAVALRWRSWPAGRVFPATLSYSTSLLTAEIASRVGISPQATCTSAVDPTIAGLASRGHCQGAIRATYIDQLQGVVYTIGVLAFPSSRDAGAFVARLPGGSTSHVMLRALAIPDTASAQFSAAARQAATIGRDGPYVVMTVAGYADGEPAGSGQQGRPSIFTPAGQLASEIIGPLTRPVTVNCASPAWSC